MKHFFRNLSFILLILLLFCLQSALGQSLTVSGVVPDLLPYAVATIAVFCGQTVGAWTGAFAGLLTDACSRYALGVAMPLWFLAGAFGGKWTRQYLRRGFSGVFLFGLAASLSEKLGTALLAVGTGIPLRILLWSAVKSVLYSALLSPLAYLLFRAVERLLPPPDQYCDFPQPPTIRGFTAGQHSGGKS